MQNNKFFSAAIALLLIAFFTTSWVSPIPAYNPSPISITVTFASIAPGDNAGTFTASGALTISGSATMFVGFNGNFKRGHCVVTLTSADGTITIHQECEFGSPTPKGQWQIVSGTGAYWNLKGNGSLLMPPNTEAMTGVIY